MNLFRSAVLTTFAMTVSAMSASAALNNAPKAWTILVYLNANNNLDPFSTQNMNEMEAVGSTDQVNVVVQITHRGANQTLRYLIKKDADLKNVTSPVVETLPHQDMGSSKTLGEFIAWGMEKYPAQHYMVDIWNHGSGWEKKASTNIVRGISYDDSTGNHITTPQLGATLKEAAAKAGSKIELVGYDACLMQMCEVASEVSEGAKFQVGSEEVEPGQGWPYTEFLSFVTAHPESDGGAVGKALVAAYTASYNGGSHGSEDSTMSVTDLSKIDAVSKAADGLAAALLADKTHRAEIVQAIDASQSFAEASHHDVFDMVDQLSSRVASSDVKKAGAALKDAAGAMVLASGHTGSAVSRAAGLAIWAPTSGSMSQMSAYEELRWAKNGQWNEFLGALGSNRDLARAANAKALFGE